MADRSGGRTGSKPDSIWYRLGYALERTRDTAAHPSRLRSLTERGLAANDEGRKEHRPARSSGDDGNDGDGRSAVLDVVLAAGAGTVAARILDLWPAGRQPGVGRLLRAGLAGAAAAFGRQLLRPVLDGRPGELDDETAEAVAAGAARGLLYAAIVEPRLFGGPVLRGAVFGGIEYMVAPWGGLTRVLGQAAPHRKLPLVHELFEGYDPADDTLVDHVAFAVALAVLYGEPAGD